MDTHNNVTQQIELFRTTYVSYTKDNIIIIVANVFLTKLSRDPIGSKSEGLTVWVVCVWCGVGGSVGGMCVGGMWVVWCGW